MPTRHAALISKCREATTVLDEPFHHDAIAVTLSEAADQIEQLERKVDARELHIQQLMEEREKVCAQLATLTADNQRLTQDLVARDLARVEAEARLAQAQDQRDWQQTRADNAADALQRLTQERDAFQKAAQRAARSPVTDDPNDGEPEG